MKKRLVIGLAVLMVVGLTSGMAMAYQSNQAGNVGVGPVIATQEVNLGVNHWAQVIWGTPPDMVLQGPKEDADSGVGFLIGDAGKNQIFIPLTLKSNGSVVLRVQEGLGQHFHSTYLVPYKVMWNYPNYVPAQGHLLSPNIGMKIAGTGHFLTAGGNLDNLPDSGWGLYGEYTFNYGTEIKPGYTFNGIFNLEVFVDCEWRADHTPSGWDWTKIQDDWDGTFTVYAIVSETA